ncbi:hypothetical protein Lal_00017989 [Lupinus albus]|uniref:Putative transcription factor C2H2 family n=1 Tax=Lupinus albus TaxID=3870 RepID=A0A6A5LYP2_LUPAL|nr:putative transcription factor C2H2 family [Lupinus albus]KAF1866606.1 hypothetical protein Lal_00017989 [Lupinus albus]
MAEVTELFPLDNQVDGLMHMYLYIITFDVPTFIIAFIILTSFFFIFYQILYGLFYWFVGMRPEYEHEHEHEHDIEHGRINHVTYGSTSEPSQHVTIFHALVHTNLQAWTMVASFEGVFDEKRGQMLRASKKLPPLVNYGNHHNPIRSCGECAICLENFEAGQFCQVFPMCKHIFHSDCIDNWLQKKLTCPICRSCID